MLFRNQNVEASLNNIGTTSREPSKQSYLNDLMQQSQSKTLRDEKQQIMENNKVLESVLINKNKFENVYTNNDFSLKIKKYKRINK